MRILLAEDEPITRLMLAKRLEQWGYEVCSVADGDAALAELTSENPPRIAVLDWMMPGIDGLDICRRLRDREQQGLPFVYSLLLTAKNKPEHLIEGLRSGAHDYLTKPVDTTELQLRLEIGARTVAYEKALAEKEYRVRMEVYEAISDLAETRDNETGRHIRRIGAYSRILARQLNQSEKFVEDVGVFAPLHDIGKVGIPDEILLAERRLTPTEYTTMKTHADLGYRILSGRPTLEMAARIACSHHEWWDGRGYPNNLKGEKIPLEARIVAIADVYDALRSWRPYKEPWTHEAAMDEILKGSGTQFDPTVVQAFEKVNQAMAQIADGMSDRQNQR